MGSFVWADLSTFDIKKAKSFYSRVFGWEYRKSGEYVVAQAGGRESAGLYTMPEKFQAIGMPSFWMSYIQVADVGDTARKAGELGGRVEVQPTEAPGGGQITLIRDPAGAGFTCYQGPALSGKELEGRPGRMVWNELLVSDSEKVKPFYAALFAWSFQDAGRDGWEILHQGKPIGAIQQMPNEVKGDKEFWAVYFSVPDLGGALRAVEEQGGSVLHQDQHAVGRQALVMDDQQAALVLIEEKAASNGTIMASYPWRSALGLLLLWIAVMLNASWAWGLFFLVWVIPDLKSGTTYFLDPVPRRQRPILYWMITGTWIFLSLYLLLHGW